MSVIINYTQAEYQAKITELEGYHKQLSTHLSRLEELKKQMFDFWNDENAQACGQVLAIQIRSVQTAMDRTQETINFYKTAIAEMEKNKSLAKTLIQGALALLGL